MNETKKNKDIIIILIFATIFFLISAYIHLASGQTTLLQHDIFDSYTDQALSWREGRTTVDYLPWHELAVLNDEYYSTHSKDDCEAYRNFFYGDSSKLINHISNKYYVSFPPLPTVPMFILTFFFGSNTPNFLMNMLYAAGAFIFAALLIRRLKFSLLYSIMGATFITVASSAFFLSNCYIGGSVWFQAQLLSLFLTMAAFYFIHGNKKSEYFTAMILLALAVGCRPFQLIYFFYFAYILYKKHDSNLFKTIKYYIFPAIIGGCYMLYNYVRFGNVFEFGHNYLPEFRLAADGQFNISYIGKNLKELLFKLPVINSESRLEFDNYGFAFWITNVLFIVLISVIITKFFKYISGPKSNKRAVVFRKNYKFSSAILFILITIHFILILLHKTLGMYQFGSRYTIDILPATLMLTCILIKPEYKRAKKQGKHLYLFNYISGICLLVGVPLNVISAYKIYTTKVASYNISSIVAYIVFLVIISMLYLIYYLVNVLNYKNKH